MIKTKGFKEINKKLSQLPEKTSKKFLTGAIRASLKMVKKEIIRNAPVGEIRSRNSLKYGRIIENIRIKQRKPKRNGSQRGLIHTNKAFWAYFYEKGTVKQKARPFFDPTVESMQGKIIEKMRTRLEASIKKEFNK